ncbi:MAG TPA: DUF6491 family protein [Rhizomicrobium sp.]|jgi:hypothetical protein
MKPVILASLAFLLTQSARADASCLRIGQIWSWNALDRSTLIVEDNLHQKFKIGLMGYCGQLPFKLSLGFRTVGASSDLTCLSKGDQVISRDIGIHYTCPISNIVAYTPEMEKADKAAAQQQPR